MAIKFVDTVSPVGDFPAALAQDVDFTDGDSLQDKYDNGELGGTGIISLTRAEYDALIEDGTIDEEAIYAAASIEELDAIEIIYKEVE